MKTRIIVWILFFCLAIGFLLVVYDVLGMPTADGQRCVTYNKIPVCDLFLEYYRLHGETAAIGYPITRKTRDGDMYIQYFENFVVQYPAGNPRLAQVHLRPLGLDMFHSTSLETPGEDPDCRYYARYGHFVCLVFLDFFDQIGGVEFLGYPISQARIENGVSVQDFENGRLVWVVGSEQPRVELADLGVMACRADGMVCHCVEPKGHTTVSSQIGLFVDRNGGVGLFGEAVSSPVRIGDKVYRCYQNACLVWEKYATEPVSIVPLGRQSAPYDPPVAPPPPSDAVSYFETGHTIVYAFRDFYNLHGGRAIFGLPLTEFLQDGEVWVQWFENFCFEWRPELPDGERVQLTPLGEINYRQFGGALPPIMTGFAPAQENVVLRMAFEYPLLPAGVSQVIDLWADDPTGRPLSGIVINLYITTPTSRRQVTAPITDANGHTHVELDNLDEACDALVQVRAVAESATPLLSLGHSQFSFWCARSQ